MLKLSEDLLKSGLHTSEIVSGFQRAYTKALEILPTLVINSLKNILDTDELLLYIKSGKSQILIILKMFHRKVFLKNTQ